MAGSAPGSPGRIANSGWPHCDMFDWVGGRNPGITKSGEEGDVRVAAAALIGCRSYAAFPGGACRVDQGPPGGDLERPTARPDGAPACRRRGKAGSAGTMVVLLRRTGLRCFSRYLQQWCMESLGKPRSLLARWLHQGLGRVRHKGPRPARYVQECVMGFDNFLHTFIEYWTIRPEIQADRGDWTWRLPRWLLQGTRCGAQ